MIHFVTPRDQAFGLAEFLETDATGVASRFSILHYEDLAQRTSLPSGCYVLAALDQLTPQALHMVESVETQLRAAGPSVRVLNSASRTLHRLDVLELLRREGLNRHRAVRATADLTRLCFPVFVREEHRHSGSLSGLLRTPATLTVELARLLMRGFRLADLLVVEFCDTADEHGVYRKYAAHMIAGEIVPQFVASGTDWMLKYSVQDTTPEQLLEERAWVLGNPHEDQIRRIFELAGVEYGRIDYSMKDDRLVTWEINLNATLGRYGPLPPDLDRIRSVRREHFCRRFESAFRAVDTAGSSQEIPIRHDPRLLAGLTHVLRRAGRRPAWTALARAVRPMQPLVERTIRVLSPILVRLGR